jgi:hypothetical protein
VLIPECHGPRQGVLHTQMTHHRYEFALSPNETVMKQEQPPLMHFALSIPSQGHLDLKK